MSRVVPFTAGRKPWRVLLGGALGAGLVLGASACADTVLAPDRAAPDAPSASMLECTANVRGGTMECGGPGAASGARRVIVGGQNVYVRLASTPGGYDSTTAVYRINVTVQNLLDQAMGTLDGVTPHADGVRVHFHTGPSSAEGTVSVRNPTGRATFLGSDQPYFQYDGVLDTDSVSASLPWEFNVPTTVSSFKFSVYVQTALEQKLVITEIMPNPSLVDDTDGEYFEVYNPGLDPVNLNGWKITSNGGSGGVERTTGHTVASDVIVPARGYAVIGRNTDPTFNGGIPVAYSVGSSITLANGSASEFIAIRSAAGVLVDSVHVGSVVPNGRSRELVDVTADNLVMNGAAWNTAYAKYGAGDEYGNFDRGTPGVANSPLVPVGPAAYVRVEPQWTPTIQPTRTFRFTAAAYDTLDQEVLGASFTWVSTNPAVATVGTTGTATGVADGQTLIVATGPDGMADTTALNVFGYSATVTYRDHLEFGRPTPGGAAGDTTDILLVKPQLALSYNAELGGPNWVSWNLNRSHFGAQGRRPTFYGDTMLVRLANVYQVVDADYVGEFEVSGMTRGHMVQSEQRTQTAADNYATFELTNILPQHYDLNTGPWGDLESYTNDLARFGAKELYNVAGGLFVANPPTVKNEGKVAIPSHTWKIVVVLPAGQGLADVTSAADVQVIVVNMPNVAGIASQHWTAYTTTVDALEAATGYDFLAALPDAIEAEVEARASATTIN